MHRSPWALGGWTTVSRGGVGMARGTPNQPHARDPLSCLAHVEGRGQKELRFGPDSNPPTYLLTCPHHSCVSHTIQCIDFNLTHVHTSHTCTGFTPHTFANLRPMHSSHLCTHLANTHTSHKFTYFTSHTIVHNSHLTHEHGSHLLEHMT